MNALNKPVMDLELKQEKLINDESSEHEIKTEIEESHKSVHKIK